MTATSDLDLLRQAQSEVVSLREFVRNSSLLDLENAVSKDASAEKIFEAWGNLRAVNRVCESFAVTVENSDAPNLALPLSPANKEHYPYFSARDEDDAELFQVCLGTKIALPAGETFAPDLSIQRATASLKPTGEDAVFCWDFKHKTTEDDRLARKEVANVAQMISLMEPGGEISVDPFSGSEVWPAAHAVLTNALSTTFTPASLSKMDIVEISELRPDSSPTRRP